MKNLYLNLPLSAAKIFAAWIMVGFILLAAPTVLSGQTLSGSSKCEGESMSLSVTSPLAGKPYALLRLNTDNSWTYIEAFSTFSATPINFNPVTAVGQYYVYQYNSGDDPTVTPPSGLEIGNRFIYAKPVAQAVSITGTYTLKGSDYVVCDGYGQLTLTAETYTNPYGSNWDLTYQLYKEGVAEGAAKTAGSGQVLTWTGLNADADGIIYTVKAYRAIATCETSMSNSVTLFRGLISNETQGNCYETIQDALDGAASGDIIDIDAGTYTEDLTIDENVTFKSSGTIIIDGDATVSAGKTLTLDGSLTVNGNLSFADATGRLAVGAKTLTLKGNLTGDGKLTVTSASNLVLDNAGKTTELYFDGAQINNLTISGGLTELSHSVSLNGNLEITGQLSLVNDYDEVVLNGKTLKLSGTVDGTGTGFIIGNATATLEVATSNPVYVPLLGDLGTLTIDNTGEVELETIGIPVSISDLNLTSGILDLTDVEFTVSNAYSRSGGILKVNAGTYLTIFGTYAADQVLDFDGASTLSTLDFQTVNNSSSKFTIIDALIANEFTVGDDASVVTSGNLTVNSLANDGLLKTGGITIVAGQFSMANLGQLDFSGKELELQGAPITVETGSSFLTDGASVLKLTTATDAWDLHSSIALLENLVIDRVNGVTMTGNLVVEGTLTLTSGDFNINGNSLTVADVAGTNANLKGTSTSSLYIAEGTAAVTLGGLNALSLLSVDKSFGVNIGAAVSELNTLTLTDGAVTGANNLSLKANATLTRTAGSVDVVPAYGNPVNIVYDGSATVAGPELPVVGSGYTANVTVRNGSGVTLAGAATALINDLALTSGNFTAGNNILELKGNLTGQLITDQNTTLVLSGTNAFAIPASVAVVKDMTADRTGGITLAGSLEVKGTLSLSGNLSTFGLGANSTLTLNNKLAGTDTKLTADPDASMVLAGAGADLAVPSSITELKSLTLNNANGTALQADLALQNLVMTNGILSLGAYDLSTISTSGGSSNSFVFVGSAQTGRFTVKDVTSAKSFPVGYVNQPGFYTPLSISNTDETDFTVAITGINSMSQFTHPVPSPQYVKLEWDISRLPNTGTSNIVFNWNTTERIGASQAPTHAGHYDAGIWNDLGTISATELAATVNDIAEFSPFALYGDKLAVVYVDLGATGNDDNTGEKATAGADGPKKTITAALEAVKDDGNGRLIIAAGSYNENVNLAFNVVFESAGTITVGQNMTVATGKTLTLDGSLTIDGNLTFGDASAKLVIDDNTLTLKGNLTGGGKLGITSSSNLVLNNAGFTTDLYFDGGQINDLTIMGGVDDEFDPVYHPVSLNSNLEIMGELSLVDLWDEIVINGNTLKLSGTVDDAGFGVITGDAVGTLHVATAGAVYIPLYLPTDVKLNNLIINNNGTVDLEELYSPLPVNNFTLTQGTLDLSTIEFSVSNAYSQTGGLLKVDGDSKIKIEGTYAADQVLDFDGTSTMSTLIVQSINNGGSKFTISDPLTVNEFTLGDNASVETSGILNVTSLANGGLLKTGGTTTVSGSFSLASTGQLDFAGQELELQGASITVEAGSSFLTDGVSVLKLTTADDAWDLHSSIALLENLVIDRANGVTMTGNLVVEGTLTLTSGNFNINGNSLTVADVAENDANLKGTSTSSLHITEGTAAVTLGGLNALSSLIVNKSYGVAIGAAVTELNTLTLTKGVVAGANNLSLKAGATVTRTDGSINAVPTFNSSVNVIYNGLANLSGPELPVNGSGIDANVTVTNTTGVTLNANTKIKDLTLSNGNLNFPGKLLVLSGTFTSTVGALTADGSADLVLLAGNALTLSSISELNTLDAGRNVTLGSDLIINNVLTVRSEKTLDLSAKQLTIKNPMVLESGYAINATGASITIAGSSANIVVPSTISSLNNLTLNNANGTTLQAGLALNTLTLTSGQLTLGAYNLTVPAAGITRTNGYVIANSETAGRLAVTGVQSPVSVPVGYSFGALTSYTPLTLGNSLETDFTIGIKRINNPADFIRAVPSPEYVSLQWDISRSAAGSGSVTFNWNAGEAYGYAPTYVGRTPNAGTAWTPAGTIQSGATTTSITVTGITSFSSFAAYKATPWIDWSDPSDITYGDLLSATQLNAIAKDPTSNVEVAGSYVYDPPLSTLLSAGEDQALKVTFTPTSDAYLAPPQKTVYIDVNKKMLTIGITANDKTYDGNANATTNASITAGLVGTDDVTVGSTNGAFENKNVGTDKKVTADVSITGGSKAGNYESNSTAETTANITERTLTLSAFTANDKVYDGTTAVTGDGFTDDRVAGDVLTFSYTVAFVDKNVGDDKVVNYTAISISGGADQLNYTLAGTTGSGSADITPVILTITGTFTANNKIFDGTTDATIATNNLTLANVVGSEDVTLTGVVVKFADALVGTGKTVSITSAGLGGTAKDNYTLSLTGAPTTTADITQTQITNIDGTPAVTNLNEGTYVAYKIDLSSDYTFTWTVTGTNNSIIPDGYPNDNKVEVLWNQTGTLQVIASDDVLEDITSTLTVTVTQIAIKGTVKYNRNNLSHTPLPGVTVKLKDGASVPQTTTSDATGYFEFFAVSDDNYTIEVSTPVPWGGGNSTDALAIQRRSIASYPDFWKPAKFDFAFRDKVGDVNANALPNATDALAVKRRAIQLVTSFPAGDWAFYIPNDTANRSDDQYFTNTSANTATLAYTHDGPATLNILAMTYGDVNSSYNPAPPTKSYTPVVSDQVVSVKEKQVTELPVMLATSDVVGAVTAYIKYDADKIAVKNLKSDVPGLLYHVADGHIMLAWSNDEGSVMASEFELCRLVVEVQQAITGTDELFTLSNTTQIADMYFEEIENAVFKIGRLITSPAGTGEDFAFSCYPNPVKDVLNVQLTLPETGQVSIVLVNAMGESMVQLVNDKMDAGNHQLQFSPAQYGLNNGAYFLRISISGENASFSKVERVVYTR